MKECPYKNDLKQDWNGGRCRHTGYYCTLEQEYRCDVKRNATKTTNADKIRSMSDEELAGFIESQRKSKCNDGICVGSEHCYYNNDNGGSCNSSILEYLQSEVE